MNSSLAWVEKGGTVNNLILKFAMKRHVYHPVGVLVSRTSLGLRIIKIKESSCMKGFCRHKPSS